MAETRKGNGNGDPRPRVRFHYLKSAQFRVIHLDGAIGGLTPNGYVHMALYSERKAIPRELVQSIREDGSLGEVIEGETVAREGIVREMDVDAIMNIQTAKALYEWLGRQITEFEKLTRESKR